MISRPSKLGADLPIKPVVRPGEHGTRQVSKKTPLNSLNSLRLAWALEASYGHPKAG